MKLIKEIAEMKDKGLSFRLSVVVMDWLENGEDFICLDNKSLNLGKT